jgi:N-carbamoylputrescine amidase
LSWVRDAAANQGAEVITLPELYSSHYFCQWRRWQLCLAEPLYSTSFIAFSALAKTVVIIVPFSKKEWLVFITIVPTL